MLVVSALVFFSILILYELDSRVRSPNPMPILIVMTDHNLVDVAAGCRPPKLKSKSSTSKSKISPIHLSNHPPEVRIQPSEFQEGFYIGEMNLQPDKEFAIWTLFFMSFFVFVFLRKYKQITNHYATYTDCELPINNGAPHERVERQNNHGAPHTEIERQNNYCAPHIEVERQNNYGAPHSEVERQNNCGAPHTEVESQNNYGAPHTEVERQNNYGAPDTQVERQHNQGVPYPEVECQINNGAPDEKVEYQNNHGVSHTEIEHQNDQCDTCIKTTEIPKNFESTHQCDENSIDYCIYCQEFESNKVCGLIGGSDPFDDIDDDVTQDLDHQSDVSPVTGFESDDNDTESSKIDIDATNVLRTDDLLVDSDMDVNQSDSSDTSILSDKSGTSTQSDQELSEEFIRVDEASIQPDELFLEMITEENIEQMDRLDLLRALGKVTETTFELVDFVRHYCSKFDICFHGKVHFPASKFTSVCFLYPPKLLQSVS